MPRNTPTPPDADVVVDAPVALGSLATREKVQKGARVFADVPGTRVTLSDGRIAAIQRETRADGTDGPMVVAVIRPGDAESATRSQLSDLQKVSDALAQIGVTLIAPYAPDPS